jgi:hypothetical protein
MTSNSNKQKQIMSFFNMEGTMKRKSFLRIAGVVPLGAVVIASGCSELEDLASKVEGKAQKAIDDDTVDFGSGDTGVLNYAYALEQLETAFYIKVTEHDAFKSIFSDKEQTRIKEIRDNELVHREFYRTVLADKAIRDLDPNFMTVDFTNRLSILTHAVLFEDTGVAAYNGSGKLLTDVNHLLVAGKIVSVEARHVAVLRNFLAPKTSAFAGDDVVNPMGLDRAISPSGVIPMVQPFIKQILKGDKLPNA